MSDDIVTRLRQPNGEGCKCGAWYYDECACLGVHWSGLLDTEAADEIERLRRWKSEALIVLGRWDTVASMIDSRPDTLGMSKHDIVANEIKWLRADRDQLRTVLLSAMQIVLRPWEHGGTLKGEWMPFSVRDLKQRYDDAMRFVRVGDQIVSVNR